MAKKQSDAAFLQEIKEARAATKRMMKEPWWPVAARYHRGADHIIIGLRGGAVVAIPRAAIKELNKAAAADIEAVELVGDGLHWEELDVDVSISGLIARVLGPGFVAREAGRLGGTARSEAKAAAARANGLKGGRPRKSQKQAV